MRLATTCRTCGRSTWTGCGQHANQVRTSSPDQWWPRHPQPDRKASWLTRVLNG